MTVHDAIIIVWSISLLFCKNNVFNTNAKSMHHSIKLNKTICLQWCTLNGFRCSLCSFGGSVHILRSCVTNAVLQPQSGAISVKRVCGLRLTFWMLCPHNYTSKLRLPESSHSCWIKGHSDEPLQLLLTTKLTKGQWGHTWQAISVV